jgi:hypothetical protein
MCPEMSVFEHAPASSGAAAAKPEFAGIFNLFWMKKIIRNHEV